MSTSLIYHAWGIRGYRHVATNYEEGATIFRIERAPGTILRCSACGSANVIRRGTTTRRWRSLPIGLRPTWIEMDAQRVGCRDCELVRMVDVGFAEPTFTYTRSLEHYAVTLARSMTISDVARHLGLSWNTLKHMVKRDLEKRHARVPVGHLRRIAIDEIAVAKGHRYMTVVMDLESGRAVFVGDGKGSDALKPFWDRLKRSGAQVQAVAIDMSPAYKAAVEKNLPEAAIVFDHFHLIRCVNQTLSEIRRGTQRDAQTARKKVVKGARWILLKNPENLDETRNEHQRLQEALALNKPLATAYYLKEDLRQLWSQPNKSSGRQFLMDWLRRARISGIGPLIKLAKTLARHTEGILAWFQHRISSGPLEGFNNKIKTMKRQAYGYRDKEFFKLKILALHEAKYALIG